MRAPTRARAHAQGWSCRRPARPRSRDVRARADTPGTGALARSCRGSRSAVPQVPAAVPPDLPPSGALQSAHAFELRFESRDGALQPLEALAQCGDDRGGSVAHKILVAELRARLLQFLAGLRQTLAQTLRLGGRIDEICHRQQHRKLADQGRSGLRRGDAALEAGDALNTGEALKIRAVLLDAGDGVWRGLFHEDGNAFRRVDVHLTANLTDGENETLQPGD